MAANQVPDEILSKILTPLLEYPDTMFCDQSAKPLLDPGFSSSSYLLVCKAWLRVSTPLLYKTVVIRTTAQAEALLAVLTCNRQFGLFIKKLRVEAGFPSAMHTILEFAPNITEIYLTLYIWASDDVRGLCSGLSLLNPRRVIVHDAVADTGVDGEPKKNRQAEQLFNAILELVPQWDKLKIFDFPYLVHEDTYRYRNKTLDARAKALASALAKSPSLETLLVPIGDFFPKYLRPLVNVRTLKSIHFIQSQHFGRLDCYPSYSVDQIRDFVNRVPQLKALVTYTAPQDDDDDDNDEDGGVMDRGEVALSLRKEFYARSLAQLKQLGKMGSMVKDLTVSLPLNDGASNNVPVVIDLGLLTPFTSLTHLTWKTDITSTFSTPPPGLSVLPNLEEFRTDRESPTLLDIMRQQPLEFLREVELTDAVNVPASVAFLQRHGAKLQHLTSTVEILNKVDVFNLCRNLKTLKVTSPSGGFREKARLLPENFIACSIPHSTVSKIHFEYCTIAPWSDSLKPEDRKRLNEGGIKQFFKKLKPESFPVLKEIQMDEIEWPTSEQEARRDQWMPLSDLLHHKGIKIIDSEGVGGPTGVRAMILPRIRRKPHAIL
ncbi:F-box domain-containing protein [Mycena venus]|uniref:F-box domain-containing protein n=1 Tax=Mycena venus TaxID=2733690 RepID=A0A8H7CM19_9AGAR|nr:F-box domain-containing protein [Mycena venus]